jgi:hypothetical protein
MFKLEMPPPAMAGLSLQCLLRANIQKGKGIRNEMRKQA